MTPSIEAVWRLEVRRLTGALLRANHAEDTDWPQLLRIYDELLVVQPSPVVALNRAVALSHAIGPARGLTCYSAWYLCSRCSGSSRFFRAYDVSDFFERKESSLYLPVTTSIIASLVLSILFWIFRK